MAKQTASEATRDAAASLTRAIFVPLARELLIELCGEVSGRWQEALHAAVHSLRLREALWDGVLADVKVLRTDCA